MKTEYINSFGYILLGVNIATLSMCILTCIFWASLCLYEVKKPIFYKYKIRMFATSLVAIVANSFALIRMFDSFLVTNLQIDKYIVQNTLVDRFGMCVTFALLLSSVFIFKQMEKDKEENARPVF
jgi:hypothetical protein